MGETLEELSCKELVALVTAYLEGALDRPAHARFEEHLAECPGCRAYVEQMRTTIHLVGTLTEDTIEPHASQALLAVFRDWKSSPSVGG